MGTFAFRVEVAVPALPDLTGFDVEATDGHIGKVDEATMAGVRRASWWTPASGSSARSA
jgi:hypothetical protein